MNANFMKAPQMFRMPYVFPETQKPSVSRSTTYEVFGLICLVYTIIAVIFLLSSLKHDAVFFFIYMLTSIIRITILVDLLSRECQGQEKATGLLAFFCYFYLILEVITVGFCVFLAVTARDELEIFILIIVIVAFGIDLAIMWYLVVNGAKSPCGKDNVAERYVAVPFQPTY